MKYFSKALLAATAIAAASTGASAANYIVPGDAQDIDGGSHVTIDLVRADEAGLVTLYAMDKGTLGHWIGQESVRSGVNNNLKINVEGAVFNEDVFAVLTINGVEKDVAIVTQPDV